MRLVTPVVLLNISLMPVVLAQPYQKPTIIVEGVLQVGEFIGPPNYGENPDSDHLEHSYFLQLPATLSAQLRGDDYLSGLSQASKSSYFVQLIVLKEKWKLTNKLIGKKVKVVGHAYEAVTGHHRTPILMNIESLSAIKKWQW